MSQRTTGSELHSAAGAAEEAQSSIAQPEPLAPAVKAILSSAWGWASPMLSATEVVPYPYERRGPAATLRAEFGLVVAILETLITPAIRGAPQANLTCATSVVA
jgi:hypothetical protein